MAEGRMIAQCHCGKLEIEFFPQINGIINCHCKTCQQIHGNYAALIITTHQDATFTQQQTLTWYASSTEKDRGFCNVCGSSVVQRHKHSEKLLIAAGCVQGATHMIPTHQIWTESAGDYYTIPLALDDASGH